MRIHLIFKTHFDFGFTDFAQSVQDQYFNSFIPQVLEQAKKLRESGKDRYIWTTGAWLIDRFLEESDTANRQRMEAAIEAGDIAWHALPFTLHSELLDASLFRHGLTISQRLDARFGKKTIAAKMTDVPGHTRGIVPLLAEGGVEFLHIGVNEAATPPELPPLFIWQDPQGAEVIVMYQHAYGASIEIPGLQDALAFGFTEDNVGPQSINQIAAIYADLRDASPDAIVEASTLDQFAKALRPIRNQLPVITQEIGDTWIHGAGTDPKKVSRYRALCKLRQEWIAAPDSSPDPEILNQFSDHLLCVAEHTWGLDEKTHLADYTHYSRADFDRMRNEAPFKKMEASWDEQRAYLRRALNALGDTPFAGRARAELEAQDPTRPDKSGYTAVDPGQPFQTRHFGLGLDASTGTIIHLIEKSTGRNWASSNSSMGGLWYQVFSEADYDRYLDEYLASRPEWGILDNAKPGIGEAGAVSKHWQPTLKQTHIKASDEGMTILLELEAPEEAHRLYGCPAQFALHLYLPAAEPVIEFDLQWFDKPACRLPEALWFSFRPHQTNPSGWMMEKMGQRISPLDVVSKGNRTLHAIEGGIFYRDASSALDILSQDAPLVTPGRPAMLRFQNQQPNLSEGWHFNLYNNLWGTNFPMWYEEDARFRFKLRFR